MATLTSQTHKATLHDGIIELETLSQAKNASKFIFPDKSYSMKGPCQLQNIAMLISVSQGAHSISRNFGGKLVERTVRCMDQESLMSTIYIDRLWLNSCGSRVIFEDENRSIFLYNPLDDQVIRVHGFSGVLEGVLWDVNDSQIFVLIESSQNFVYLYSQTNIWHPAMTFLGASARPKGYQPLILQDGILNCKVATAEMKSLILPTHQWTHKGAKGIEQIMERFNENLALLHFKEAWKDALILKSTQIWDKFTQKALEHLEVEIAIKSCQQSRNIKMISYLHHISEIENRALLTGHIFLLFGDHDAAEDAFLKSTCPEEALEMRINLKQWEKALILATELGISSLTEVKFEHAQFLERHGEYHDAVLEYEGLVNDDLCSERLNSVRAGIARTSIHCGDIWKGRQMAMLCNNTSLYVECGGIVEAMKLYEDAALLYEMGGQLEKAFYCYIACKNFCKAFPLLEQISRPKFYIEYAKAVELEGNFSDAVLAFENAKDYDNVVRLLLGPLQNPSKAYMVVRTSKSVAAALNAAKFCKSMGDYSKAIEFFILSRRSQEAKKLAEQHDKMDVYMDLVVDFTSKEECIQLAKYYETTGEYSKAANLLERCGEIEMALKLYLIWGTSSGIEQAIELVRKVKCGALTEQLLDHISNQEQHTEEKNLHLYMLHKALENFDVASNLLHVISDEEQGKGNYKKTHQLLLGFCLALKDRGLAIPEDILSRLLLLHSYVLGKISIRLGDHCNAAQLMVRVARNITKFPIHIVPILTSTVIECDRAGFKSTAFEFATKLMHPDHRNLIAANYKRKVEKIVRKFERVEEKDLTTPCPFCMSLVPNMQLECHHCNRLIPFCIASGRHMVLGDWSICPHCKFPALATEFAKILQGDSLCPMCSQEVTAAEIVQVENPFST